jgi:hypothetical protein
VDSQLRIGIDGFLSLYSGLIENDNCIGKKEDVIETTLNMGISH